MKKPMSDIFREMIPVILGILVALFINSWNEHRKDINYIKDIFKSIRQELAESKADIVETIPKQVRLIDTLKYYRNDDTQTLIAIAAKADGLHAPRIRTSAWSAISRTKIELVDYDQLRVLTDIEDSKALLKQKLNLLMNFATTNIHDTSRESKESLIFLMSDLMITENGIKNNIERFETIQQTNL